MFLYEHHFNISVSNLKENSFNLLMKTGKTTTFDENSQKQNYHHAFNLFTSLDHFSFFFFKTMIVIFRKKDNQKLHKSF